MIDHLQYCHSKAEPEILLAEDADTIRVPGVRIKVVTVAENHKYPCWRKKYQSVP